MTLAPLPKAPLVSIVIATYNRATMLRESIQSVIDQTYTNWELIIVDDGSSDDTRNVLESIKDSRVRSHFAAHTGLLGKVRNIGIRDSTGELIAFQDSDDLWSPDKLALQIALLHKHPQAAYVLSSSEQFGENATPTPEYENVLVGRLFTPLFEEKKFHFCGTSLIFRKEVSEALGLLDESSRMMRELFYFLRMSAKFEGIFSNKRLVKVRRHKSNTSNQYQIDAHFASLQILESLFKENIISSRQLSRLKSDYLYRIGLYQSESDPREARKTFLQSLMHKPTRLKTYGRILQTLLR